MSKHEWCQDVPRDEAVRAAEDAAAVPSIQHRDLPDEVALLRASLGDILGRVVRLEGEMDAGQAEAEEACAPVSPADGLRTELVTLEVCHYDSSTASRWLWHDAMAEFCPTKAWQLKSVRVVEDATIGSGDVFADVACGSTYDEVQRLTAERDAARADAEHDVREVLALARHQRDAARAECERLRARVSELERAYSAECDTSAQAHRELSDLNDAIRARESGEERDGSYAAQCREAAAARDCADRMTPAPAAGGEAKQEPVAWAVLGRGIIRAISVSRSDAEDAQAQFACDTTVVPLYAAPPEPRGWMTAEARAWLKETLDQCRKNRDARLDEGNVEGARLVGETCEMLTALLARETPPRVRRPPRACTPHRDAEWIAAIRAAGGEVE